MLCALSLMVAGPSLAQIQKHFSVESEESADHLSLNLTAPSGTCYLVPTTNPNPVTIYGHTNNQQTTPRLRTNIYRQVHVVNVDFENTQTESISTTVTRRMFGGVEEEDGDMYKVYLSEYEQFQLNLIYDSGEAFIDLSGLSVDRCKVNAGNADVKVSYMEAYGNQVKMDTFMATVDLGSLSIDRINMSQARHIIADVGFGTMVMGFDAHEQNASQVTATVGAGSLDVQLENPTLPVIVRLHNSPLCKVQFPKDFEEIEEDVWINAAYREHASDLLSFDVEVSMGNLMFLYQDPD